MEDSEQAQTRFWIFGFEAVSFLLIIATRFFLNYFQSYHALASFIPVNSGNHNVTRLTCLQVFGTILAVLTILSYLMVRWRYLHEGFQCKGKKIATKQNPCPRIYMLIYALNFLGILALSAYAAIESIHTRKKIILYGLMIVSIIGALPTTILFSRKSINDFFINAKKLPKVKSVFVAFGTLCMTPLIVIALHTILIRFMHPVIGWWNYFAWSLSVFVGLGYIIGELFINCRLPKECNTIKSLWKRYTDSKNPGKAKLILAVSISIIFLAGASFVMAGGAYVGTYRCIVHMTSPAISKPISLTLFFITLFVALFGSFGEDFLGKMVNKISPPSLPKSADVMLTNHQSYAT